MSTIALAPQLDEKLAIAEDGKSFESSLEKGLSSNDDAEVIDDGVNRAAFASVSPSPFNLFPSTMTCSDSAGFFFLLRQDIVLILLFSQDWSCC